LGGSSEQTDTKLTNIKGSALASRILWVRLNQGEPGLEKLKSLVSPELTSVLANGAVMATWYPLSMFIELNVAIDKAFGKGDLGLIKSLGRHGADANLTTIYRLFFKVGTVKWIMARAARLWGMHYDSGRLLVKQFPGKEVEMEIIDYAAPHRVHCLAVQGWAERSIELSGAKEVALDELGCRANGDEQCHWRVTWR
jgi:hypothetical protein